MIKKWSQFRNNALAHSKVPVFIALSAILSGCANSKHMIKEEEQYKPYVIDVDKFDPVDFFERMKVESEAREKSKITTCYLIGNVDIRLVLAAESDKEKVPLLAYDSVTDMKGQPYHISKITALDRNDIERLCVEKTSYRGNDEYSINLLLKKESWDKVHEVTQSLVRKRLAFIKEQTVISAPVVQEPLVYYANVTGDLSRSDIDWFVQGLTPTNLTTDDSREKAITDWMERWVQNHPDDSQWLILLAWRYYERKEKDCKKTTKVYEKAIRYDPSRSIDPFLQLLHACYTTSSSHDEAIRVYNEILAEKKMEPWEEVYIRMALADAFDNKGDRQQLLQELGKALSTAKSMSVSYP